LLWKNSMHEERLGTPLAVAIIAANEGTRDGLRSYFREAGVRVAGGAGELCAELLAVGATGLVLFPDDFAEADVLSYLRAARARRPLLALVTLTRYPQRWHHATTRDGRALELIVLPRPSFGWTIVDALRRHGARPSAANHPLTAEED
jgi:hypothetical protein